MGEIFKYEVADGAIHIEIVAAERKTYGGDYYGKGAVEEFKGQVRVSTSPEFKSDTNAGFVKVRGRKYAIEQTVSRYPDKNVEVDRKGRPIRWHKERSYTGGYRSELGRQVEYTAKAHDALDVIRDEALALFEMDHPDWVKESTLLFFKGQRDVYELKARGLQQEAQDAQREAEVWGERALALKGELA